MSAAGGRTLGRSSFSRATSKLVASSSGSAGVKIGPNGASFVSSGIPDLDNAKIIIPLSKKVWDVWKWCTSMKQLAWLEYA
ncbi:Elongator complex protein 4 [Zea mays]|uniref:Elongator complex protein 4 n=1 Tax=Zea mays TaxID=4577 RepID=A0A1D6P412_MAIZE|nr:Elongator complex protein 4 [Zea mays]